MKFILSDGSVNRYGFRVLTEGIMLDNFKKNPVMLYNHQRRGKWDTTQILPIGKWENIEVKDGKLLADAVFDENDELAMKVKGKVEKGMLNTASINFDVLTFSEETKHMVKGQTRPTVTVCELMEASIVDIPGNAAAVKLSFSKEGISLSGDIKDEYLNAVLPTIKPHLNMDKIALKLGLKADATEEEILAAMEKTLSKPTPKAEEKANPVSGGQSSEQLVDSLISLGKSKGVINDENESHYKKLAAANFDSTLALINGAKQEEKPEEHLSVSKVIEALQQGGGTGKTAADDRASWTLSEWRKKDHKGLEQLRATKPQEFEKLMSTLNTTV